MSNIGWGDVKKNSSPKKYSQVNSTDLFVKFTSGKNTVRLVGEPHEIYVCWMRNTESGKNEKYIVPKKGGYIDRLKSLNLDVRKYYATNCFVLEDDVVRLRILEKGPGIFESFYNWYSNFKYPKGHKNEGQNINPGGVDGPNFLIVAETPSGKNQNLRTNYSVMALQQSPFTKEQIEVLKRGKVDVEKYKDLPLGERGAIDLSEYYNEERAEERLKKKLQEISGISSEDDSEEISVNQSSTVEDLLTNDEENSSEPDDDSDLVKQAEEILGDLF